MLRSITHCLLLFGLSAVGFAEELPLRFDLTDGGPNTRNVPQIKPWKSVPIDPDYGGDWCVTGDLDGDGIPEVVSAKNKWNDGIQYTTSAVAHRLDGSILWKWGNPDEGH
ncbi:MAG: hypothetical protein P8K78_06090, partial [Pirellulales bacterium]|nr:hypothetical protein [Pirellulales bacterium]